jgi:predicted ArsR family transcriptional regulator
MEMFVKPQPLKSQQLKLRRQINVVCIHAVKLRLNMPTTKNEQKQIEQLDIPLERDGFCRTLISELAGTLQDVVGLEEAAGFISVVGQTIGRKINSDYQQALGIKCLNRQQVEDVLLDLKHRIKGNFSIEQSDDEKIVFSNTRCPFEDKVIGRPSMCMMTSNVFGSIAADNLGYARVVLHETIAEGSPGCKISVFLKEAKQESEPEGREYYQVESD